MWIACSIPDKDASNRTKHGVSLALAGVLFSGPHRVIADDRFAYGEVRQVAFGRIEGPMFACVFTERDGGRRVISLRKANSREVARHGPEFE